MRAGTILEVYFSNIKLNENILINMQSLSLGYLHNDRSPGRLFKPTCITAVDKRIKQLQNRNCGPE